MRNMIYDFHEKLHAKAFLNVVSRCIQSKLVYDLKWQTSKIVFLIALALEGAYPLPSSDSLVLRMQPLTPAVQQTHSVTMDHTRGHMCIYL